MTPKTIWRYYLALVVVALASLFGWALWRDHTCVPCSARVRLDKPGTYDLSSRWFARKRYGASFVIGVSPPNFDWYKKADEHLWQGSPPEVEIRVRDASGTQRLLEGSALDRTFNWTVSGTAGSGPVEVYKTLEFEGVPLRKYSVSLTVLRGSKAAARYPVTFQFRRICEYEPLGTCFVIILIGAALAVLSVIPFLAGKFMTRPTNA